MHVRAQVSDTLKTATDMLSDLAGYERFCETSNKLKDSMEEHRQDAFQSWTEQMITSLDDPDDPVR